MLSTQWQSCRANLNLSRRGGTSRCQYECLFSFGMTHACKVNRVDDAIVDQRSGNRTGAGELCLGSLAKKNLSGLTNDDYDDDSREQRDAIDNVQSDYKE